MFSGLTKELNSWLPITKKEEIVLTEKENKSEEIKDNSETENEADKENKDEEIKEENQEPKTDEKSEEKLKGLPSLEMFGNVKSQVTSWLGSASIPGLKKSESVTSPISEKAEASTPFASSEDSQIDVKTKAMEGAKNIGNFLYSAVNKAGQTVTEASVKIKKTVEDNTIIGEFNKEQESFIKEKNASSTQQALPPWIGHPNEEKLKEDILTLSKERKNFTRNPPPGVDFEFDYNSQFPIALVTLNEDPELKKMRFELVPKVLSEEMFWRNYFYRISLIVQRNELTSMEQDSLKQTNDESSSEVQEQTIETDKDTSISKNNTDTSPSHDFISDTFSTDNTELDEVKNEMKKLGIDCTNTSEEEWEKQLDEEIHEFELVSNEEDDEDEEVTLHELK